MFFIVDVKRVFYHGRQRILSLQAGNVRMGKIRESKELQPTSL